MQRFVFQIDVQLAKTALLVVKRVQHRLLDVLACQRVKLEHTAARDDCARHGNHGVFRRGADKADRAFFQRGQERIRLGLAPAVALVEQQIRRLAVELEPLFGFLHDGAQFLDPRGDRVELDERAAGSVGNDGGQRGFARARRAKEDGALEPVGQNGAAKQLALAHDMLLSDKLVQRTRAHPVCKRRTLFYIVMK